MYPTMNDLRATRAVMAHRYQGTPGAERPSPPSRPKGNLPPAPQQVRSRIANLFSSIGKRLQHRHVWS